MPCPPGEGALEDGSCQSAGVPAAACTAGRFEPDGRGGCEVVQDARSVMLEEVWVHETGEVGVGMLDHAGVTVRGVLLEQNGLFGLFVEGSEAVVEATVVRAIQPNRAGEFGWGINVRAHPVTGEGGQLSLMASLVEENHEVGVYITGSEATVESTVVRATKRAPADPGFGDGILVTDGLGPSHVTLVEMESTDTARIGMLYMGSTGEFSSVRSSGNRFGLVLQGDVQPTLGEGNSFAGNLEQGKIIDGELTIPEPAPVPPAPTYQGGRIKTHKVPMA